MQATRRRGFGALALCGALLFGVLSHRSTASAADQGEDEWDWKALEFVGVTMRTQVKPDEADKNIVRTAVGQYFHYDDNLYSAAKNEKDDTAWIQVGGFKGSWQHEDWEYNLEGQLSFHDYTQYDDEDHSEFKIRPEIKYTMNDALSWNLKGNFTKTVSPVDVTTTDKTEQHNSKYTLTMKYTHSEKTKVDLEYVVTDKDYAVPNKRGLENLAIAATLKPRYKLTDKLSLGLDAYIGSIWYDYTEHNEPHAWGLMAVAEWKTSDNRWNLTLKAGPRDIDYDHSGDNPDKAEFDSWVYDASIKYTPSPEAIWSWKLAAKSMPTESTVGNFYVHNRFKWDIEATPTDRLSVKAHVAFEHMDESNDIDSNFTTCGGALSYVLWAPTGVTGPFSSFACGLGLRYEHKYKESEKVNGDYVRNRAYGGLWATYTF